MEDVRECRICLDSTDQDSLLQPCKCNTAYVHEDCLQTWRRENINNEKYSQCEICREKYIICRSYQFETFRVYSRNNLNYLNFCYYTVIVFMWAIIVSIIDIISDMNSIILLNFGEKDKHLIYDFYNNEFILSVYYVNYTSYIFSMCFYLYVFGGVLTYVHRKNIYWDKNKYIFSFYFLSSWNYFYNYYIWYKLRNDLRSYVIFNLIGIGTNYLSISHYTKRHNMTIDDLNNSNKETFIEYDDIIEITTINQEEEEESVPLNLSNSLDF